MSKAFTKEDDDGGFVLPEGGLASVPAGPFRLTATGARKLAATDDPRLRAALERAEVLEPQGPSPERAALGVTVVVRADGGERSYRLVSAEERALLGEGCSVGSPLGRALLGAREGDVRELKAPRGTTELEVVALRGEAAPRRSRPRAASAR